MGKKCLIYNRDGGAILPTVDVRSDFWRIYFGYRNKSNHSRITFIDVEAGNPSKIIYEHNEPIFDLGVRGCFDDCGQTPAAIVEVGSIKYLYYVGWSVKNTVPFDNHTGLAILVDGVSFNKKPGPLLGKTLDEPYFTGTFDVIFDDGKYHGYYMSGQEWIEVDGKLEPTYCLKYCSSQDGIHWVRENKIAIGFKNKYEGGICEASVLKEECYKMWYSYRNREDYRTNINNSYRIGYAESNDAVTWTRMDESAGIKPSIDGWDSEMICYPCVIKHDNTKYMFYNGNAFGKTGFGYAIFR